MVVVFLWISINNGINTTTMFCILACLCMRDGYADELCGALGYDILSLTLFITNA